ncbi:MAG: ferredoxin--NADP reductase [Capnocytophaga sp.]|nr:ferredoxin--NADP reductase [Capnocytophaga sp.]
MNKFHPLTVRKIEPLTASAVKISFEIPEILRNVYHFEAGQYITLQQTIDNQKVRRAYSICSTGDDTMLSVAVKRIEGGIFSTYATTQLKEGDVLEVLPPLGSFIFFHDIFGNKDLLLVAAGSGITPMMSILKTALSKTGINIVLLYGNKSAEETLFFNEIETLKNLYPNRLHVHYAFSRKVWNDHHFGRIGKPIINYTLNQYKHLNLGRYYICGPQEMVDTTQIILEEKGIEKDKIFTELFVAKEEKKPLELEGQVSITTHIDGHTITFVTDKKVSLLEAIVAHGGDAPYSCQGGVCSSCMAHISDGKAEMIKNQTLTDKEIADGLILTCQAYATTDTITVDYDNI